MVKHCLFTIGVLLCLWSLYAIVESLANPGRRCSRCRGVMEMQEHTTTDYLERWLFHCPDCQAWEVEHIRTEE
jgi:hypothetical protein